jgi:hypothetical protein
MKLDEVAKQLNRYSEEINEAIRDKPDRATGYRGFNPVMSEFLSNRGQSLVLTAFFDVGIAISVGADEPLSKELVAKRMLAACQNISALMEEHTNRLKDFLEPKENES